jgi:hypothetical protein
VCACRFVTNASYTIHFGHRDVQQHVQACPVAAIRVPLVGVHVQCCVQCACNWTWCSHMPKAACEAMESIEKHKQASRRCCQFSCRTLLAMNSSVWQQGSNLCLPRARRCLCIHSTQQGTGSVPGTCNCFLDAPGSHCCVRLLSLQAYKPYEKIAAS